MQPQGTRTSVFVFNGTSGRSTISFSTSRGYGQYRWSHPHLEGLCGGLQGNAPHANLLTRQRRGAQAAVRMKSVRWENIPILHSTAIQV
eukprot:1161399-Pelagomonas_calceolata.AAC.3